jgi:hypothetical protein
VPYYGANMMHDKIYPSCVQQSLLLPRKLG